MTAPRKNQPIDVRDPRAGKDGAPIQLEKFFQAMEAGRKSCEGKS